jgi:hypothetical protein
MKKLVLIFLISITGINTLFSIENDTTKITSKPLFLIYSNFHQGLTENSHESNFDVKRAYLGYDFNLNNGFYGFIKIDIGTPDDDSQYSLIRRDAYLRNVGITYKKNHFKINFGIIDNQQHKTQEKFWGKRYIYKSFLDEYDLLPSTDLGFNFQYNFNKKLRFEAGMMNGEYLCNDAGFLKYVYNIGLDYSPINIIKLKIHSTYTSKENDLITAGIFLGLSPIKNFKIGGEYNLQAELKNNDEYISFGYNAFAVYDITKKINLFARYDVLCSNIPFGFTIPFNQALDGSAIISGVEYIFNNNFRMSLNYQDWSPDDISLDKSSYIFFNLEFCINESYKRI